MAGHAYYAYGYRNEHTPKGGLDFKKGITSVLGYFPVTVRINKKQVVNLTDARRSLPHKKAVFFPYHLVGAGGHWRICPGEHSRFHSQKHSEARVGPQ